MRARSVTSAVTACAVAALVLALIIVASLALGSRHIEPALVWDALRYGGQTQDARVVLSLRVPRTLAALVIGAALGLAGSIMQAVTRNPLADPGVLGVNAGAAFLVVVATAVAGVSTRALTMGAALVGAGVAAALVFMLSGHQFAFNEFRYWVSGSLEGVDMASLTWAGTIIACGAVLGALLTSALGVLTLGDDAALGLGVRVRLIRCLATLAVTALAGGATALGGPLTFVGLAVPLLVRRVVGARQGAIAVWSAVVGAAWVCAADVASRLVLAPQEVPVGVVVALVGAPFFVLGARGKGMS